MRREKRTPGKKSTRGREERHKKAFGKGAGMGRKGLFPDLPEGHWWTGGTLRFTAIHGLNASICRNSR
jgi:hypothetical protein